MLIAAIALLVGAVLRMQEAAERRRLEHASRTRTVERRRIGHPRPGAHVAPSLAEAVSATGGVAVALGVLLITIDIRADDSGRVAEIALFAGLIVAGYLALGSCPRQTHAAGVSAVALGDARAHSVGALLPGAHSFGDIRPFLVLTILGWVAAFVASADARAHDLRRGRGRRPCGSGSSARSRAPTAYSATPIPSPPAHTVFSLQSFARRGRRSSSTTSTRRDPLYSLAVRVRLRRPRSRATRSTTPGDPGERLPGVRERRAATLAAEIRLGRCDIATGNAVSVCRPTPFPSDQPDQSRSPASTNDKSFEIGLVSVLFGIVYLGALFVLDRARLARPGDRVRRARASSR